MFSLTLLPDRKWYFVLIALGPLGKIVQNLSGYAAVLEQRNEFNIKLNATEENDEFIPMMCYIPPYISNASDTDCP